MRSVEMTAAIRDQRPDRTGRKALACILLWLLATRGAGFDLKVQFDVASGALRNLNGVNDGPRCLTDVGDCDLCGAYQAMGIPAVRTHDLYGPTDWDHIFPDFSRDPGDPASYDFSDSDPYLLAISSCGEEIFYRMGVSWGGNPIPPADPAKWARIAVGILQHYNDGWANGFHLGIREVEIWNEPDLWLFWRGTPRQYFALYEHAARAIKAYDPAIRVGGPAVCCDLGFLRDFLQYCRDGSVPLDFVSWHHYGSASEDYDPSALKKWGDYVQSLLTNAYGFPEAGNYLTEFNRSLEDDELENNLNLTGAAWSAAALIHLQDGSVDAAFRYRGDIHPLGMWWPADHPWPVQEAYAAMAGMNRLPMRVKVGGLGDLVPASALAGCDAGGRECRILLADPAAGPGEHRLRMTGLAQGPWTVTVKLLAESGWRVLCGEARPGPEFTLHFSARPPFIAVVDLLGPGSEHARPMAPP
jgi:hypothetical protein